MVVKRTQIVVHAYLCLNIASNYLRHLNRSRLGYIIKYVRIANEVDLSNRQFVISIYVCRESVDEIGMELSLIH